MDYKRFLKQAQVPEDLWPEAIASLQKSHDIFYPDVLLTKASAPFVVPFIIPFLKWEDEQLPKWASRYDNNISLNGDRANWKLTTNEDGIVYGKRGPAPLDKDEKYNDANNPLNYYAGKLHVRHWLARLVWLGFRNPGGGYAFQRGPSVANETSKVNDTTLKFNIETWGHENPQRNAPGVQVNRVGSHWQIRAFYKWRSNIWIDANLGYKVNNLAADYGPGDPDARLCVCHTKVPYHNKVK